jgi:vancomycin permeability regulator SanA
MTIAMKLSFAFAICFALVNAFVIVTACAYIYEPDSLAGYQADAVVVLGARVYKNGSLSTILRERADRGITLYEAQSGKKLLFSGDHGTHEYDEVNALKAYALSAGVPLNDIFLDHAGFSTYESMVRAKKVFGAQMVVIVTQRFHLYRAVYVARYLGLDAVGVVSDQSGYPRNANLYNEFRESFARVKDWLYVTLLHPPPKYLGAPIDLAGSGTVSHD